MLLWCVDDGKVPSAFLSTDFSLVTSPFTRLAMTRLGEQSHLIFSEKSTLWTDTSLDQNFQRDLRAPLLYVPCFPGISIWTNGLESSSRVSPETGIGPWVALPNFWSLGPSKPRACCVKGATCNLEICQLTAPGEMYLTRPKLSGQAALLPIGLRLDIATPNLDSVTASVGKGEGFKPYCLHLHWVYPTWSHQARHQAQLHAQAFSTSSRPCQSPLCRKLSLHLQQQLLQWQWDFLHDWVDHIRLCVCVRAPVYALGDVLLWRPG